MRYLRRFEAKSEDIVDELKDLFIHLEEIGYHIRVSKEKIVKDRDDWTGNFACTKLRNVYGGKFIYYTNDVIMSKNKKQYLSEGVILVTISRISYINDRDEDSIVKHWKKIDKELLKYIRVIENRAKAIINLKLYGIMSGWYSLGKASHSDFENKPYFGYDTQSDFYMIAFENK